ncbi:MAG TPA: VOC family protein [Hyphomicrobiaceae bacterium]|nr:VOC family protein [Hyphomicrobiaceae bacterium]
MAPIKARGLNHISLTVKEIKPLLPFFMDGLGYDLLSLAPRDPDLMSRMTGIEGVIVTIAFLEGYGHRLELIQYYAPYDRKRVAARLCDMGANHLGYDVDSMEEALGMAAHHGFAPTGEVIAINAGPNQGRRVAYVQNSDGVTVEFLELRKL